MPCPSSDRPNIAFSAQADRIQFDPRFVIPTFIDGVSVLTLRVSGHSGTLLVDHSLVSRDQFVPGRTIRLKGAFNNEFVELPIARVLFRSTNLGCTRDIEVEAAVTNMPSVFYCDIGNALFEQYPQMTDIIHCKVHHVNSAPNQGSSLLVGQGDTGTSSNQLIDPVMESHLIRNEQVMTSVQTDVNNHHETPGDQPGVPVTNQFHALDKVDELTRAVSSTGAETDDGAQTENDRRHRMT